VRKLLPPTLALLLTLIVWEAGVRLGNVPAYLLPPPSAILLRIGTGWQQISVHAWVTLAETLVGFGLAIVISIPLAAVLSQVRWIEQALYPLLVASQTIPKVALAPLLVVWFGFGQTPKILITFLICFFPIVVDTMIGLRSIPREVEWLSHSMGASAWKTFFKIRIPAALPNVFAGIKVASTLAVVGAVVGEFVASDAGLGYQLIVANGVLDVQLSFAVLVILSVMGILLFVAVDIVERLLLPWHISQRRLQEKSP
jgi:NitT/TauT family transport system permease protein